MKNRNDTAEIHLPPGSGQGLDLDLETALRAYSDERLLSETLRRARNERRSTIEVLMHLREVDERRLHLVRGHGSLFQYAVKELGYSEPAASERINAMRLMRSVPAAKEALTSGELNLTNAARMERYFQKHEKETRSSCAGKGASTEGLRVPGWDEKPGSPVETPQGRSGVNEAPPSPESMESPRSSDSIATHASTPSTAAHPSLDSASVRVCAPTNAVTDGEEKARLVARMCGASTRDAERILLTEGGGATSLPRERARMLDAEHTEIRFVANAGLMGQFERLREIQGSRTFAAMITSALDHYLDHCDPLRRAERSERRKAQRSQENQKPESNVSDLGVAESAIHAMDVGKDGAVESTCSEARARSEAPSVGDPIPTPTPATVLGSDFTQAPAKRCVISIEEPEAQRTSRTVPANVRHAVTMRSGGRCEFVDAVTNRRCESRFRLEYHHIVPFALGGPATEANIAKVCRGHNILHAIRDYGVAKMAPYLSSS